MAGNVLLRVAQYRALDDPSKRDSIVRNIVMAKLANSRLTVVRAARETEEGDAVHAMETTSLRLLRLCEAAGTAVGVDAIRGMEGEGARVYFSVFDRFIRAQRGDFSWRGRSRRPPLDNVNALLSFVYTLLAHDVASALECVGLDPAAGFLHTLRPARASLALDLVEELRAILGDRLVLTLINRRQISGAGFRTGETGGVLMDDATRREVLASKDQQIGDSPDLLKQHRLFAAG